MIAISNRINDPYDKAYRIVHSKYDITANLANYTGTQATIMDVTDLEMKEKQYELDGEGNRDAVTATAPGTSVRTAYTKNVMNEYTSVGPEGNEENLVFDDNGNLIKDGKFARRNGTRHLTRGRKRVQCRFSCFGVLFGWRWDAG